MIGLGRKAATVALVATFGQTEAAKTTVLEPFGKSIVLSFPNDQMILGVGGLTYDGSSSTWTAAAENIPGSPVEKDYPETSLPRIYHMLLDFVNGSVEFLDGGAIFVEPKDGLKLEDINVAPPSSEATSGERSFWVTSEANSHLVTTSKFLSKDFGAPDLSTYDPNTFSTSKLFRVDGESGAVLEEAVVPEFAQWEPQEHDWDSRMCVGDRPFQGLHGVTIVPNQDDSSNQDDDSYTMIVAIQAALYQDGPTPTEFDGSATRMLFYNVSPNGLASDATKTASFMRSYRYDTSQLTLESFQKGSRHFNALFGVLALNETALLVAECEDFMGFGSAGHQVMNRIFYVEFDPAHTVDHCASLLDCDVLPPTKYLIWERKDDKQLDGLSWGPLMNVSGSGIEATTVALTFENDDKLGVYFELYTLDMDSLQSGDAWEFDDQKDELRQSRITTVSVSISVVCILVLVQFFFVQRAKRKLQADEHLDSKGATKTLQGAAKKKFQYKHYAIGTSMLNSFLVGGVTFGFSGMSLMLRKEGVYADKCACGSFCAAEKEELALVSTIGFAVAIGSRLFVGLYLDLKGPKATALACSMVCLAGFILLGATPTEKLPDTFLYAWILMSFGGSGLHIAGFHMTNLFKGETKKVASAAISAAFGASSAIFPIWQIFNQYLDVSIQSMAIGYAVVVGLVAVNNFLVQPWKKVQPGIPLKPNVCFWQSSWWSIGVKRKPIVVSTVMGLMSKFEFWGETIFYSLNLLLLTHYLSTSAAFLYEKGDVPFTSNPNDWTDYMYTRLAGWFNSLGFLWYPTVQLMMLRLLWPAKFATVLGVNLVVVIIVVAIPQLEPQVAGFVLMSFSRLMLFSFHHAYILDKFGIEYFGLLNGVSSFIAALVGLVSYPLQLYALTASYAFAFIPIGCSVAACIFFPVILRRRPVANWAESYAVDPRKFRWPHSVKELVELINGNEKIRCAGAMHSCAPLVISEGIIIQFDNINKILEINAEEQFVRVQPGVRVHDLCEALKPYNLAMGTLGTIDWQTVVGAVMTGTHGGSLTTPSMHTFVDSYTLVKANGEFKTVDRESDPKLFSAMAPCMGVFGVVVEAKVRVVKLRHLEAKMHAAPFSEVIPKVQEIMRTNKYARIVVYPSLDMATIWTANEIENQGDAVARGALKSSGYINFRDENEKAWLEEWLALTKKKGHNDQAAKTLRQVYESQLSRLSHYEGQYNHVLCKERNHGIPHADIEFGFEFSKAPEILHAVREWYLSPGNHVPYYNFEIRTTMADDAMMSCCHKRETLYIDFQAKFTTSKKFFGEMEDLLEPFGYRKHWAKGMCHSKPEYIVSQFPMVGDFVNLIAEYDPIGKFRNEHISLWYQKIRSVIESQKADNKVTMDLTTTETDSNPNGDDSTDSNRNVENE